MGTPRPRSKPLTTPFRFCSLGKCNAVARRSLGGSCGLHAILAGVRNRPGPDADWALEVRGELGQVRGPGAGGDLRRGQATSHRWTAGCPAHRPFDLARTRPTLPKHAGARTRAIPKSIFPRTSRLMTSSVLRSRFSARRGFCIVSMPRTLAVRQQVHDPIGDGLGRLPPSQRHHRTDLPTFESGAIGATHV
jgi:hypothetical protein